jgi:hypothetical protein
MTEHVVELPLISGQTSNFEGGFAIMFRRSGGGWNGTFTSMALGWNGVPTTAECYLSSRS